MASSTVLLVALIVVTATSISSALNSEQISRFMTKTLIETNTGEMGMVTIVTENGMHTITSNGIPDHVTPEYPNQGNPNDITVQTHHWTIPVNPTVAESTTELPLGPIGVAINGVPFFNPYTATGEDAVLTETFDSCDGHPTDRGVYHYHKQPASCVFSIMDGQPSPLIGVALDGFPIYGPIDETGRTLTSADLDECHGRFVDGQYRYHTTADFPYIMGCFKGAYSGNGPDGGQPPAGPGPNGRPPPGGGDRGGQAGLRAVTGFIVGCVAAEVALNQLM